MVFSSVEFLFFFLPLVLLAYFVVPRRARNGVLLLASLIFYTWGGGALIAVLALSIVVDYFLGWYGSAARARNDRRAMALAVIGSVVVNLSLLGWFKYAGFFAAQFGTAIDIVLPIGISFFTFQSMSYTIDVVRGRSEHLKNPLDFALYVALFPQLIAGPIVRYHEIAPEIRNRTSTLDDIAQGALRFGHGLVKKVVVADAVAAVADAAFAQSGDGLTFAGAWIGVTAYALQIYFDFSGYADMAIGLGRVFGFTFPENFNRPYSAISITDFWRRWHITLSNWFRDYVYLPLGGSRRGQSWTYVNLSLVFLATGLWHGAAWNFVLWGVYNGGLMLAERVTKTRWVDDAPNLLLARARTFLLVLGGWVLFRAPDLGNAVDFYAAMLNPFGGLGVDTSALELGRKNTLVLVAAFAVVALPRDFVFGPLLARSPARSVDVARVALTCIAVPYAAVVISAGTFTPFLYFRF